jgi:DNA-binding GntR family transcriptional regulator
LADGEGVVARTTVRDQVKAILQARIVSGELDPGQTYSAVALADTLGVSATPVREAMLDLASAGLVEAVRNRGFRVLTVSDEDLDEIVLLRGWLEVPAMSVIIDRAGDDELTGLRPLADQLLRAARDGDATAFLVADRQFHLALLELTRSRRLVRLVAELRGQTQLRAIYGLGAAGELEASGREHVDLLDALCARDKRGATALMRRHVSHARGLWAGNPED